MEAKPKKIYIGDSGIHGKGIFAKQNIKKGETIGIMRGKMVNFSVKNKKDSLANPNWIGIDKNIWIDPITPYNYLNHSCNPNIGVRGKKTFVAMRNIKKDEEIHIDYSITEVDTMWHMRCNCKEKKCRGVIYSIQKLPEKVYNHYLPFISKKFQNLYVKAHESIK